MSGRVIASVVAVLVLLLFVTPWGRNQLRLSFTRLPPAYTELYFANPAHLPNSLKAGATGEVPFVIRNSEGRSTKYSYVTTVTGPGEPQGSDGQAVIASGQAIRLNAETTVPQPGGYVVTIRLLGRPEMLQFKITVTA